MTLCLAAGSASGVFAQQGGGAIATTPRTSNATRVVVSGDAVVQAQPDTAVVQIAVVTQGKRAIDAQTENARRTQEVIGAVKREAGAGAEVKTSNYALTPMQNFRDGQPPVITGYEARNTVAVTMNDLGRVGPVIDAASAAGANNITNLSFTLKQDKAARDEALVGATREALAKAQTMARALGGSVARVVEVQEANAIIRPPMPYVAEMSMARAASTPIEIGSLEIRAHVQLIAEIDARP